MNKPVFKKRIIHSEMNHWNKSHKMHPGHRANENPIMKPERKKLPKITCGIFLYNTITQKLLICHATNSPWNKWTIPKGIKNPEEDSFTAASRELFEETGIDLSKIHILKIKSFSSEKYEKQDKILESFLVITDTDLSGHSFASNIILKHKVPEIDKWSWMDPDHARPLLHESQQKKMDEIIEILNT